MLYLTSNEMRADTRVVRPQRTTHMSKLASVTVMTKKIIILALAVIVGLLIMVYPPTVTSGQNDQVQPDEPSDIQTPVSTPPPVEIKKVEEVVTGKKYDNLVRKYSQQYGVSYNLMDAIIDCENRDRDTTLQSYHVYDTGKVARNPSWGVIVGERERSFGLVQIHLPSNPDITHAQAIDPDFAIEFLAKSISQGYASRWSCYNKVK